MTDITISDPREWRPGDYFKGEYLGHKFEGEVWAGDWGTLYAGATCVRYGDTSWSNAITGVVTRTVPDIEEPTVPWALVRFEDGEVLGRLPFEARPWSRNGRVGWEWADAIEDHGAPVAVSLPSWSDEPDDDPRVRLAAVEKRLADLRAGVRREGDRIEGELRGCLRTNDPYVAGARDALNNTGVYLRALLAEGGEE